MKYGKMPNSKGSSKGHGAGPKSQKGGGGNINKSDEMRADVTKTVSNRHPYPQGMS